MHIFLTGATGFLGSHTAEELIRRGHSLSALRRTLNVPPSLTSLSVRWIQGTLPESSFQESLKNIETVVHVAGAVKALSEPDFFRINATGTQSLVKSVLEWAPKLKRFIYISTVAVHNPTLDGENFCLPTSLCHPLSIYGRSKLAGEEALSPLKGKIQTIILRPPVLYGPRDQELLPLFQSIRFGFAPLLQSGSNELSVCFAADVARAIADLVETPLPSDEIFCLDDGGIHTWRSLAETVSHVMRRKPRMISIPKPLFKIGAGLSQTWAKITRTPAIFTLDKIKEMEQPRWVCGSDRLQDKVGWSPQVSLQEGMKTTYQYYKSSHLLG